MSFPPGNEMFQFPGFASVAYVFSNKYTLRCGFPHSEIFGSKPTRGSPKLIAACHVLHRLSVPRHSPNALVMLDPYQKPDVLLSIGRRLTMAAGLGLPADYSELLTCPGHAFPHRRPNSASRAANTHDQDKHIHSSVALVITQALH